MFSHPPDDGAAHDDRIGDIGNQRGIVRSGHPEPHGNRRLRLFSDLRDVVTYPRHVVQFSSGDAGDGNIIDKSAGLLRHIGAPRCRAGRREQKNQMETRRFCRVTQGPRRSEEHTSELQSPKDLVCRLLLEKKKKKKMIKKGKKKGGTGKNKKGEREKC